MTEKTGLTNSFDPIKSLEVEAIVDTRTTTLALPQNIIDKMDKIIIETCKFVFVR